MPSNLPFALTFPLQGNQLIEASAGTGKTFTISTLYLRLVLGHGTEKTKFSRPLLPPEILVMTFTDAATQELRDRIRTRLAEAARYFRNELAKPDQILTSLREEYLEMEWPNCAQKLEIAAQWMDEAAVSTIHSWCQRMLKEHAFDSGNLFRQHLVTDHSDLLAEVARDYWRTFCYPLTGRALDWVIENWQTPESLQKKLTKLLSIDLPLIEAEPAYIIEHELTQRQHAIVLLKKPWLEWTEQLRLLCDEVTAKKLVDGRKLQKRNYDNWCNKLKMWAEDEELLELDLATGFDRLTEQGFSEIWKSEEPIPKHPALQALPKLKKALEQLPDPATEALTHAAQWIKKHFEQQKIRRAEIGFDDLLTRLDGALQSTSGQRLAKLIRQQFPVAMVDEFQDTDLIQYRILSKIYLEPESDAGLFLIGDPKQAIYAFRGADIYTYLKARRFIEQRLHHLDTNYRSSQMMVEAANHLFNYAEQYNPTGAFLFKASSDNPLPFYPVKAQDRKEAFEVSSQPQAALTLWHQPTEKAISTSNYLASFAETCASEITRLLNLGQQSKAGFRHPEGYLQPLRPSDIAILVRNAKEARAIREALAVRNVRSVYLSDKDSVLRTQEAQDLLIWLEACAQPDNEHLIKTALATITLDLALQELDSYNQHENIWEERILQFRFYKTLWRTHGVLPMLRRFLQDFKLPERLLANAQEGERMLTNLLHLSELLQQAATELDGEQALIRYLAERLDEDNKQSDEYIVRLESDEQLVKVITIHKSKGLEYPLVFLPFICSVRKTTAHHFPMTYQDEQGNSRVALEKDNAVIAQVERANLAEDLRLLYVAITRAKYNCWLGIADTKYGTGKDSDLHYSAIGYLLNNGNPLTESAQLTGCLEAFAKDCAAIQLMELPEATEQQFTEQHLANSQPSARVMQRKIPRHWWISSYSSLRLAAANEELQDIDTSNPETATNQNLLDDDHGTFTNQPVNLDSIHGFPRGPIPGTFLHGLLDWASAKGFAEVINCPDESRDYIARRCNIRGWEHWIDTLQDWLQSTMCLPLPLINQQQSFASLPHYLSEMEFMFACNWLDLEQLDALVKAYILPNQPRPPLEAGKINGMLKGFIDLTFESDNRYYIVDYKSNWLGENNQAYTEQTMAEAMLVHRYDLQLVLYQLALHRQLRARLPDYSYEKNIGGVFYLFLRGYQSETGGIFYQQLPVEFIEQLDQLFTNKKFPEAQ